MIAIISENFIFNGIHSTDYNIIICRIDSGLINEPYISGKNIIEDSTTRNPVPFFYRSQLKPLEFTLTFAVIDDNGWTDERKYEIANWLIRPNYCELISCDNIAKRAFVLATSDIQLVSNGIGGGYIQISFRAKHPYFLSPIYIETFDLSDNDETRRIQIDNKSNVLEYYNPQIEFQLQGNSTGISLKNLSDGGRVFSYSGLNMNETVFTDNEHKKILSDTGSYRYDNFNGNWFRLVHGVNYIEVTGKCILQVKNEFPIFI